MNDPTKYSDGFYTLDGEIEIVTAAKAGNFSQVIKTLERCNYDPDVCEMVIQASAARGNLEILEYLDDWDKNNVLTWHYGIAGLIVNEKIEMIKRIINKRKFSIELDTFIVPLRVLASKAKDPAIYEYFQNLEREIDEHERNKEFSKAKFICEEPYTNTWN